MPRYLLPCSCGQQVAVGSAQAGQTVVCTCGQKIDIPRLRELQRFPRAEEETPTASRASSPKATWTAWHGLALSGLLTAVVALVMATYLSSVGPHVPTAEEIYHAIGRHPPGEIWGLWRYLNAGLGIPTDVESSTMLHIQSDARQLMKVSWFIAGIGTLVGIGSWLAIVARRGGRPPAESQQIHKALRS